MTAQQQIEIENLPALPEITPDQWSAIYEGGDYLSNFIQRVRDEVGNEVPDLSTKKGRARVASLAAQVSKAKAAVEKPWRDYLRDIKAKVKPIEENIREFVRAMDDLRDQARKPLTEWEENEKARIRKHEVKIEMIKNLSSCIDGFSSYTLREKLAASELFEPSEFEEFEGEAATALLLTQKALRDALARREAYEAEQAEQEAERQRLAEECRQIELEKATHEDQEHRATINRAALADLMALELDEATAKRVLIGIIQGKVRNVGINY